MLTHHAQARIQQRGLSKQIVEDLLFQGSVAHEKGADIYLGTKACVRALISEGRKPSEAESVRGKYIVCINGVIVTAGQRTRRLSQ